MQIKQTIDTAAERRMWRATTQEDWRITENGNSVLAHRKNKEA
jgi:hypothetical protein